MIKLRPTWSHSRAGRLHIDTDTISGARVPPLRGVNRAACYLQALLHPVEVTIATQAPVRCHSIGRLRRWIRELVWPLVRAATKRRIKKSLWRNWGYLVLALVVYGWFVADVKKPILLLIGSGLIVLFALFFAETPCAAVNKRQKDGGADFCGNNGNGLLGACHLQRHRWENLKMLTTRQQAVVAGRHVVSKFCGQAAAFSAAAGIVSCLVATATLILARQAPLPTR